MVIGGGGREHAIVHKLRENPEVREIYVLPGNGGIGREAQCVPIRATDIPAMVAFAKEHAIGFAVVAPDDPLVLGAADALREAGIPTFGPSRAAAAIEGSKVFAKDLMRKYGIPTAAYRVFTDLESALTYLDTAPLPAVIKADGLALGKGVVIAQTREEGRDALRRMMTERIFGDSGSRVVIEEYLTGPWRMPMPSAGASTLKTPFSAGTSDGGRWRRKTRRTDHGLSYLRGKKGFLCSKSKRA